MARIATLTILIVYITFVEAYLDLHFGKTSIEGVEGSNIEIVCETEFRRYAGENDDELRQKLSWLRGGPEIQDLDILASIHERISIETEILSETETKRGRVEVKSTLFIRGVTLQDATNYTCCKRDEPMCIWPGRQQRQLQLIVNEPQTTVPQTSTDKQTTMMTSSFEWRTNNPLEPSTLSTVVDPFITDDSGIAVTAFRKNHVVYTVALPCMLALILFIVVICMARYQWRRRNVNTPVQSFELEA